MNWFTLFILLVLSVCFASASNYSNIKIYNVDGSVVYNGAATKLGDQLSISGNNVSNGIYFVDFSSSFETEKKKLFSSTS